MIGIQHSSAFETIEKQYYGNYRDANIFEWQEEVTKTYIDSHTQGGVGNALLQAKTGKAFQFSITPL